MGNEDDLRRKRRLVGATDADNAKVKAAKESAARRGKKSHWKQKLSYFLIVGSVVVCLLAAIFALVWAPSSPRKKGGGSSGPTKLDKQVNDKSFVRDVNRNADGNFTAKESPHFDKWTFADVKWGMDGAVLSDMIGMPGAVQYCEKEDEVESGVLPPQFDSRLHWPVCVSDIYDSGNCTASYAIAAASSLAHRFCVADPTVYGKVKLSPQQILSCDKKSKGCKGGGIDFVWAYMQRRGLYPESCLPYVGQKGAVCKTSCDESKKMKALDHCVLRDTKHIKREVFNQGSVVAPMVLHDDFLVYSGGIYTPTDNAQTLYGANGQGIMHAVTILGWGKSEGVGYWLIENSWGSGWGEDGYAKVAIGSALREGYVLVGHPATPEAVELAEKKAAEQKARAAEAKKERAARDERIKDKQRQREEEMRTAREAAEEEDFDKEFDDDLDIDLDDEAPDPEEKKEAEKAEKDDDEM